MPKVSLFLLLFLGTVLTASAEGTLVNTLTVIPPSDYDLSWFDGDFEKSAIVASGKRYGSIHVTFFKTSGKSEIEYNPSASDARKIETFLTGKSTKLPDFYPPRSKKIFLENFNRNVLDSLTLCEFEIENIQFTRRIITIDSGYCYVISITIKNVDVALPQEMPELFQKAKDSGYYRWNTNQLKKLNEDFQVGKAYTGYLARLLAESEKVVGNLSFR